MNAAEERLQRMNQEQIGIPLGAAFGSQVLAGSGPVVPVKVVPRRRRGRPEFHTEFETSGINQTRHKVYMTVTA